MADSPGVDTDRLAHPAKPAAVLPGVRDISGQLGQALRGNEFLNSIVQRSGIAGGAFDFDLPQYHYWLQMPQPSVRWKPDDWRHEVGAVQDAVDLLLTLIRNSAVPTQEHAPNGFYQGSLPSNIAAQLVRVGIPSSAVSLPRSAAASTVSPSASWSAATGSIPQQVDRDVPFLAQHLPDVRDRVLEVACPTWGRRSDGRRHRSGVRSAASDAS